MHENDLLEIEERWQKATPGPWYMRHLDDDEAMSLIAVSTSPDIGRGERWPDFDAGGIVAATLVQAPRYVDVGDGKWEANAAAIAHAPEDVRRLTTEIRRLQRVLALK